MRRRYRALRIYAASMTGATVFLATSTMMWVCTRWSLPVIGMLALIAAYVGFIVCAAKTNPKRIKKTRKPINYDLYALYEVEIDPVTGKEILGKKLA